MHEEFKVFTAHDYPPNRSIAQFSLVRHQKVENKQITDTTSEDDFVAWRQSRDSTLNLPKMMYPALNFNILAGNAPKDGFIKIPVTRSSKF